MIPVLAAFGLASAAFVALGQAFGPPVAFIVAFGTISAMAAMISATFLWLWLRRATPLALGMSVSWAGTAAFKGWWWVYYVLNRPEAMRDHAAVLGFLALSFAGAVMHFAVMRRSMGVGGAVFVVPVIMAVSLSVMIFTGR